MCLDKCQLRVDIGVVDPEGGGTTKYPLRIDMAVVDPGESGTAKYTLRVTWQWCIQERVVQLNIL